MSLRPDVRYEPAVEEARLLRRYKRFLADVEWPSGQVHVVHVPNPGSMRSCAEPGRPVRVLDSQNPKRKLRYTLEQVRMGRRWVSVNTARANPLVAAGLARQGIPSLRQWRVQGSEVTHAGGSRFDFQLVDAHGTSAWMEVKQVSLREGSVARFPDAVTARGRKHLDHLRGLAEEGARCIVLFAVSREDVDQVGIAWEIDPAFGEAALAARDAGVSFVAVQQEVRKAGLRVGAELPLSFDR